MGTTHGRLRRRVIPRTPLGKVRLSRGGAHWFDRATGLNILVNEIAIPPHLWSQAPRYVSIALTNTCELRCPYCYAPKVPGRLRAAEVLSWLEELDQAGSLGVGFGGGEPTAHPEFVHICVEASRRTRMAISFTTHGHRVTPHLVDSLRGHVHFVRVSVDGVGATYERLRGRSFNALRNRLALVADLAPFGLNVVVNDQTVTELDAIASLADDVGAGEILLLPEQPARGRTGITTEALSSLTEWIARHRTRARLAISEMGVTEGMPIARPYPKEAPLDAYAHVDSLGVLKLNAFTETGIPLRGPILEALTSLRSQGEL